MAPIVVTLLPIVRDFITVLFLKAFAEIFVTLNVFPLSLTAAGMFTAALFAIGFVYSTIGANAFYGCKNLNTVVIKKAKLTSKTVGDNAFAKTGAKPVVTVPAKQFNTYKTLLRSKGMSTKAVYKK